MKTKQNYSYRDFPQSRIATFDVFAVGLQKHHISALLEFDVTGIRKELQKLRRKGINVSFTGWLLKAIAGVLHNNPEASAWISGRRRLIIFNDINISIIVEKQIDGERVPIPLVIEKAHEKSAVQITGEIEEAVKQEIAAGDVVLGKKPPLYERLYYFLPGAFRRAVWRAMLNNPKFAFARMGNVSVTSVGMMGRINGWFIHKAVHPLSFGIGSVLTKPAAVKGEIKIRDILNMTVLVDHDVIDGAQMVRLLQELTKRIEKGPENSGSAAGGGESEI